MFVSEPEGAALALEEKEGGNLALVAEDHPTTLKLMCAWLEASGYQVECASNGRQAWEVVQAKNPRLVITDWSMPEMSGVELCRSIREVRARHEVYVLIATARDGDEDIAVALDAGASDFVAKPICEHEFLARVRSAEHTLKHLQTQAEMSETDPLTKLFNRRFFDVQCQQQIRRARDFGLPLSCIALDIDYFKHVNDTFGHAVGDQVLIEVALVLREETRQSDIVCRRGGDEFCVLLVQSSEERAFEVAQRIHRQLGQRTITFEEKERHDVNIQVSMGVAGIAPETCTAEDLVDRADKILIQAKNCGRNRVLSRRAVKDGIESRVADCFSQVRLDGVEARDVMAAPPTPLCEDEALDSALRLLLGAQTDCAPVVDQEARLLGIVSERDLLHALSTGADMETPVGTFMSSNVARFHETTPVREIWECLQRTPMLRVIIVKNDRPTGMIGRRALLGLYETHGSRQFASTDETTRPC